MSGPNAKKKRAKLEREMEVDDGMGDDFGAFLSGLDHISEVFLRHVVVLICGAG